ncbi:RNA polymerase sigma factor [Gemmatimonadota bacterium]
MRKERGIDITMTPPLDTHDLLRRSRNGDMDAFRLVVGHYRGYASALAIRMLCDIDEADDVVQEAFIRVWRHLADYDPGSRFTTWLYTIVTNLCFDRLRSRKRDRDVFVVADGERLAAVPSEEREPDRMVREEDTLCEIRILTRDLPPKQRVVFVLRDLQDLDAKEVSEITGINAGAVRTNLFLARRKIREGLERSDAAVTTMDDQKGERDEMPQR